VVILQHEDNYLSVYKGMNRLQVQRGDVMRAGEVIGRMGDDDEAMRNLDFELWKKGVPVNPEDVMVY
jgi:septal ring factor EnvC (AmiA/AmiB activator)